MSRTCRLFSFFLLIALAGCGTKSKDQTSAADPGEQAKNMVTPVAIACAERKTLAVSKTYTATLEGVEQANIVPKIAERITDIRTSVGQTVRAGEVIVVLDKSGASSQFYQAQAGFRNAEKTLLRMRSLYDEGAIALEALDAAQTAYDVSKANFDGARSAVELSTPVAGVVTALNVNLGDLTAPGVPLATVARIDRMKAIFSLNEEDVTNLAVGQQVQVYSETRRDLKAAGTIVQLSKSADIRSRSFEVKALFRNVPGLWFKPGMFCRVIVGIAPPVKTLVVPSSAILTDGMSSGVFQVINGLAIRRPVRTGVTDGTFTEILDGLAVSDTVVTTGATSVKDSSRVSIVQPTL